MTHFLQNSNDVLEMSILRNRKTTAFPLSNVLRQNMFFLLTLVLNFGKFIPLVRAALAATIADRRQRRCFMGAMLQRQAPCMWEWQCLRDVWEVVVGEFTELWNQNFRMTCSTFDELRGECCIIPYREPVPAERIM